MQVPSAIRRRVESIGQSPPVSPGEELAALADGGLDLEEFDPVRLASIQMRYGPIAIGDVLAPHEATPEMPFRARGADRAVPILRFALFAAGIVLMAGVVAIVLRGTPTPISGPGIASNAPDEEIQTRSMDPPATPSPGNESGRMAIHDPSTATRVTTSISLGPAALGLSVGRVVVLDEGRPRPAVRSDARVPPTIPGSPGDRVFGVVESIDPGTGEVLVVLRGRTRAWATAAEGAVRVGDALTFSDTPGMLTRSGDAAVQFVAGEDLDHGEKIIEVLLR